MNKVLTRFNWCISTLDSLIRGDRAFSVARITALTLAQHAFMTSRAFGMHSLVFAGHFPDVCGVRDVITAELSMKNECVRVQNVSVCSVLNEHTLTLH